MEQDEVIRRLKGLSRGTTPPAPDFSAPVVRGTKAGGARFTMGPIVAAVGVLALAAAALAVPDGSPLRQVVAGLSTEVQTDVAEVEGEVDADLDDDESGASGSVLANPCEGPPPTGTPADDATDTGLTGGASVEIDPDDREAQIRAWREWREANCGPEADRTGDDDGDDADDSDEGDSGKAGRGQSGDKPPTTHPHEDDPCKGPPPHSNRPSDGESEQTAEERHAEQEAWKQWHHENCPPGQANDHPGHAEGHGRPEDAGKPDDAGRPDGAGKPDDAGRPDGAGKPDDAGRPDGAGKPGDDGDDS